MLRKLASVALACLVATALAAAPAASPQAAHKVLANGLEVFVVENHAVPLVTVCVTFRGGASAQDAKNAGLFHLYEHMMFDGNEKYPTQASFMGALNRMGVSNWNGATSEQYINYYITVPSDKAGLGIEFWSWAIKKPIFDDKKLEAEKQVVINEIRGYHTDPDQIASNALESRTFPALAWRKNIDGPEDNIQNATVAQLQTLRDKYYIPKNTAVMLGGDIKPADAYAMVEKWFGDWKGGPAPVIGEPPQAGLPAGVKLLYPDEQFYQEVSEVDFKWRAPDVLRQTKDTYTSDVFLYLLSSPVGKFKSALMDKGPGLYDPEYIEFNYTTARDGGTFDFFTYLAMDEPGKDPPLIERNEKLRALVLDELALVAKDPEAYFGKDELAKAKAKLIDLNLLSMETASNFVTGTLTFWWAVATTDYFFSYEQNCNKVSWADVSDLIKRYLVGTQAGKAPNMTSLLRANSEMIDADAGMAELEKAQGYTRVDGDNAFWWQKK